MLLVLLLRFRGAEERLRFPPDLPAPAGSSRPLSWADAAAWLHLEGRDGVGGRLQKLLQDRLGIRGGHSIIP